jgi:aryl-alcohol dehydrogenase-like predicted oxidoreductase
MRLLEKPDVDWQRLLLASIDLGVTTMHASTEYESHARFCELLKSIGTSQLQFIVKLADPHFGEFAFDRARMCSRIDQYLRDLGTDRLDVVQWMWRGDLKDEPRRLLDFATAAPEIRGAFDDLRRAGKIGAVAPFPYTSEFAAVAIEQFDGLTVYLNSLEREMLPQIERAADRGLGIVAIRPFAAGKALAATSPGDCIAAVLAQRGVATAVVSYSSLAHLEPLIAGVP